MRAYYNDNVAGDQRLPHIDTTRPDVSEEELKKIDIQYWFIPIDADGNWEQVIYQFRAHLLNFDPIVM
jgi:1,2-dihydroxy-3-keto-5-methylthiopentene dioxygenase